MFCLRLGPNGHQTHKTLDPEALHYLLNPAPGFMAYEDLSRYQPHFEVYSLFEVYDTMQLY